MSEPILDQIERFAPGARARVLAMRASSPAEIEAMNPNDVGVHGMCGYHAARSALRRLA
jgi:phytoene dehydrogenase-like protein